MTSRVLIFAPYVDGDAALWNSRWIARETARNIPDSLVIEGCDAIRTSLESAFAASEYAGVLLCGHGDSNAVFGADDSEALDATNMHILHADWAHLLACNVGLALVGKCADHRALVVGYRTSVIVEFTVEQLPIELYDRLKTLLTIGTQSLLAGTRKKAELRKRINEAAENLVEWLIDHTNDGDYLGIHCLAETLVDRIVTNR